jgi:tryptophan-rich sensory protein
MNELQRFEHTERPRLGWLGLFAGATALVSVIGGRVTRGGRGLWYRRLRKPAGQPPPKVFGPVWTVLYGLMSWSAFRIFRAPRSPERSRALRIWWTQLALNGAWSPIFFGSRRKRGALVDLAGTVAATVAYIRAAGRVDRLAAKLMAPYLAWLGYAGYLNGGIVALNRR